MRSLSVFHTTPSKFGSAFFSPIACAGRRAAPPSHSVAFRRASAYLPPIRLAHPFVSPTHSSRPPIRLAYPFVSPTSVPRPSSVRIASGGGIRRAFANCVELSRICQAHFFRRDTRGERVG